MFQFKLPRVVLAFCAACSLFIILFSTPIVVAAFPGKSCSGDLDCPGREKCYNGICRGGPSEEGPSDLLSNSTRSPWLNTLNNSEFLQSCLSVPTLPNNPLF